MYGVVHQDRPTFARLLNNLDERKKNPVRASSRIVIFREEGKKGAEQHAHTMRGMYDDVLCSA